MKLYMIRHGQSVANLEHLFSLPEVSLTEEGKRDAERAGRMLQGLTFDRVLVSPYLRARQTQEIAMPNAEAEVFDALHECDCGFLEGHSMPAMKEKYPSLQEEIRREDYTNYGGENYANMRRRVREIMDYVISTGAERVAAFSHAGLILTFFDEVMQREGKEGRNLRLNNGSISIFEYKDGKWWVVALNIAEHY